MQTNNNYIGRAHSSLVDRYLLLRVEERSPIYQHIYDRWISEIRLLIARVDSKIVNGDLQVKGTIDDFVDQVNTLNNENSASIRTVQEDLKLIRLHVPLPDLRRYIFKRAH